MSSLPFGSLRLPLDSALLPGVEVRSFAPPETPPPPPPGRIVARALAAASGPSLRELARGARSAVVLVPGINRVAAVGGYVPPILAELHEAGVGRIQVFLATGTHAHRGREDLRALLGDHVFASIDPVVHDPRAAGAFVDLGSTSRGTPVEIARSVVESDLRILTGRVVPHYFAGFGGGRKALVPGAASARTIFANHRLTLAPTEGIAPGVAPCQLDGNPVHLDMLEAAAKVGPSFSLAVLLDAAHRLVAAHAGDLAASHAAACAEAQAIHQQVTPELFDGVVTSAGGAPYDCNFIQALKALFDVETIVRPGGAILALAECPDGIAPALLEWAKVGDADLDRAVRERYDLGGHNTIMLRALRRRAAIGLVSRLDPDVVHRLGLVPFSSFSAGVRWLAERCGPGANVAAVPFANVTHVAHRPKHSEKGTA